MKSWLKTKTSLPDGAVARHHAVRGGLYPLHEPGFQVLGEGHELYEASRVQEEVYPLPCGELALLVLLFDAFLPASLEDPPSPLLKLRQKLVQDEPRVIGHSPGHDTMAGDGRKTLGLSRKGGEA